PASRLQIIGWVGSEVQEIRKHLLEVEPSVLLYEGDPRRLDPSEISAALRKVCERAAAKKGTPWPTTGTIRRLARPELANAILGLLREYRGIPDVERHLLRYAELGRYETCLTHALELALDRSADASSRAGALSVIRKIGGAQEKAAPLDLVSETSVEIRV